MGPLWGIDLGGTKIEGVILEDANNINVLKRLRVPTESKKGYDHILNQISKLVEVLSGETGLKPSRLGICTPGVIDPISKTLKNSNTVCMNGQTVQMDLQQMLNVPVVTANDANCCAIAEAKFGAVKEHIENPEVVFGVIMGTGVGGGVVVKDHVIYGRHGIGGEWGHNFLDESGGECYCGRIGCVETIISGPSLERYYESIMGKRMKLKDIVANHRAGTDPIATKTVQRLIHFFGKGIANVINIIDPDAVVICGGVGNVDEIYTEGVKEVKKYLFNHRLDTLFLKPKLGDSAGVFGAALL